MARPSRTKRLCVFMNGERIGAWSILPNGTHEFRYEESWIESPERRPISLSLPLAPSAAPHRGAVVESFFDNLLPDNADLRRRVQRRFGTTSSSPFDLLSEIGRDCVGAVQLLPDGMEPGDVRRIEGSVLDEEGVAAALRAAASSAPAAAGAPDDDSRISISGAREKTALLRHGGRWCRPRGTTPTTHILKLPLGPIGTMNADMSASVENEWICSCVVAAYGLPVAPCGIERFGGIKALVVERFDRRLSRDGTWWLRLPQEDFCQANGIPPDRKYENEGGPGMASCLRLLLGARNADADRRTFFKAQVLFWMLAAPDGHAKNFSVFLEREGRYTLTPFYDVMSAYPVPGHGTGRIAERKLKLAMAVIGKNRHYEWARIRRRHWISTAASCGMAAEVDRIINDLIARTPAVVAEVESGLPPGFPEETVRPILDGLERASEILSGRDDGDG